MTKRIGIIALATALYCGGAAAQDGPSNIVQALLGPTGPVQGLFQSARAGNLQPLVDGLVSDTGLIQGEIAQPLNFTLSGLLVKRRVGPVVNGVGQTAVTATGAVGQLLSGDGLQAVVGSGGLVEIPGLTVGGNALGGSRGLALPGLQNGDGFSADQMREVEGLLQR